MTHRALACRWNLGVFPVHYRYLSSIGLHMYLDDLRSLIQKEVSNPELSKIRIALTGLSGIWELDCFSALQWWLVCRLAAYLHRRRFLLVRIIKMFSLEHTVNSKMEYNRFIQLKNACLLWYDAWMWTGEAYHLLVHLHSGRFRKESNDMTRMHG